MRQGSWILVGTVMLAWLTAPVSAAEAVFDAALARVAQGFALKIARTDLARGGRIAVLPFREAGTGVPCEALSGPLQTGLRAHLRRQADLGRLDLSVGDDTDGADALVLGSWRRDRDRLIVSVQLGGASGDLRLTTASVDPLALSKAQRACLISLRQVDRTEVTGRAMKVFDAPFDGATTLATLDPGQPLQLVARVEGRPWWRVRLPDDETLPVGLRGRLGFVLHPLGAGGREQAALEAAEATLRERRMARDEAAAAVRAGQADRQQAEEAAQTYEKKRLSYVQRWYDEVRERGYSSGAAKAYARDAAEQQASREEAEKRIETLSAEIKKREAVLRRAEAALTAALTAVWTRRLAYPGAVRDAALRVAVSHRVADAFHRRVCPGSESVDRCRSETEQAADRAAEAALRSLTRDALANLPVSVASGAEGLVVGEVRRTTLASRFDSDGSHFTSWRQIRAVVDLDRAAWRLKGAKTPLFSATGHHVFQDCDLCPKMVRVPRGSFKMGSSPDESGHWSGEGPRHEVRIGYDLAVGIYAVTFVEWDACAADGGCNGYTPADGNWGRDDRPVINVSWEDAQAYIRWLNEKTENRYGYRLLSESEWEYVARAGTTTAFWWGDTITPEQANYRGSSAYNGGATGEYRKETVPVKSFDPNPWGLYQVHGNVWEWVEDCWHGNYEGAPRNGSAWTTNCSSSSRVLRGGSWHINPRAVRSAYRVSNSPVNRSNVIGFRLARTVTP